MFDAIKDYAIKFWGNTKEYFKINTVALIVIGLVIVLMAVLFLPHQKKINQELQKKFNAISQNYDSSTGEYKNVSETNKLQEEATEIQSNNELVKLFKIIPIAAFLGVLSSLLAWLMQFLYTTIKFTKADTAVGDPMRVLTAALWVAAAIVCIVFVTVFSS